MESFLSPQNDVVFKLLFCKPENNDLLISFLTAVLQPRFPITSAIVLNPEITRNRILEKGSILDVVVELQDKSKIDIEMQVENEYNFRKRILFYWSRLHQSQLVPGDNYTHLRPSVAIAVLGYKETNELNYHSIYELRERHSSNIFSEDICIHLIELPKLNIYLNKHPEQAQQFVALWSKFFEIKTPQDLEKLAMEQPIFRRAEQALYLISGDPEARQLAEDREKARMNFVSAIEGAKLVSREEGMQVGLEQGEKNAQLRLILAMIAKGMPSESISEITQMPVSEIDGLRKP